MRTDCVRMRASPTFSACFLIGAFLYLWLRINPSLYLLEQNINFQGTFRFLQDYLSYPGGVIDYCSAFLSIFFIYPAAGAGVVTILLLFITFATHKMLRLLFGSREWHTAHLFPAVLCGALQCNYDHPLSTTIALTIALLLFVLYEKQHNCRAPIRVLLFFLLGAGFYYCAGGAFLFFALLCALFESLICRRWVIGLVYAAFAVAVPYVSKEYLFLVSTHDAWLYHLPFGKAGYSVPVLPYLLYAFFPALIIITPLKKRLLRLPFPASWAGALISYGLFIAATIAGIMFSFYGSDHDAFAICKKVNESRWTDILDEAGKEPLRSTPLTDFAIAQALFHKCSLSTYLFSFPHYFGARGIFLSSDETAENKNFETFSYFFRGELAFKLGLINSAQHWFYEALSTQGVSAPVLRRLAQVHALKGDFPMARICLSILETMPLQRKWARQFLGSMEDGSFVTADTELSGIRKSMPTTDFLLADSRQPYLDCEEAVRQHPSNRMTFEYCMASCLLSRNLPKFGSLAGYIDSLGYTAIPPVYEQALLMLKAGNYPSLPPIASRISQATIDNFMELDNVLYQANGNFSAAKETIQERFRNTYWNYHFFMKRSDLVETP